MEGVQVKCTRGLLGRASGQGSEAAVGALSMRRSKLSRLGLWHGRLIPANDVGLSPHASSPAQPQWRRRMYVCTSFRRVRCLFVARS